MIIPVLAALLLLASMASAEPCSFCDVKVELTGAGATAWVSVGYQLRGSSGVQNKVVNFDLPTKHGRAYFFIRNVVPCNSANQEVNFVRVDSNRKAHSCAWTTLPAPFETAPTTYRSCLKDQYKSCSVWRCKCKHGDTFKVTYYKGHKTCRPAAGLRSDKCSPAPPPPKPAPIPCNRRTEQGGGSSPLILQPCIDSGNPIP